MLPAGNVIIFSRIRETPVEIGQKQKVDHKTRGWIAYMYLTFSCQCTLSVPGFLREKLRAILTRDKFGQVFMHVRPVLGE
jgi:hypothetical protein